MSPADRQSLPHHVKHIPMVLLYLLLRFTHHLHLKKVGSLANIPTWAVAMWMSRKPRDSRYNQNMVPVDGSLEETLSVLTGTTGLWLSGKGKEQGGGEADDLSEREGGLGAV